MNKSILRSVITAALIAASQTGSGGDVTIPNSFTAGTPAVAAQVNANFSAVKTAVDDNYARILTLQSNPSLTGNLTLVPSISATVGNIMKGTVPFLHNYGTNNTFLGASAGNFTMTGAGNTASGAFGLANNTTGFSNTASGVNALWSNTTGNNNTASGVNALALNTTGSSNTASGALGLSSNTSGGSNTASGVSALLSNTTGDSNTASGDAALLSNTTGGFNTASGQTALFSNTTGNYNTAVGAYALQNSTGNNNVALGYSAGANLTTGINNIAIDNAGVAGESNTIRLGDTQTRTFIAGIRGRTTGNADAIAVVIDSAGQLGTVSSSRRVKDDIADMGKASQVLMQLRPVTFHYKSDQNPKGRALQYGLIAEEVAAVAPELVAHSANGEIETVYYQHLTPMLLNEYQKQQRTIAAQSTLLAKQTARLATLEKQALDLAELKAQVARMTAVLSQLQKPDRVAAAGRP